MRNYLFRIKSKKKKKHTPTNNTKFKDVFPYIGVKDFHKGEIHVESFQAHPGEGNQEEIVKKHCNCNA